MTPNEMHVEHNLDAIPSQSTPPSRAEVSDNRSPKKKIVTVEDSVEAIAEVIGEIQASDPLEINISIPSDELLPSPPPLKPTQLRFSIAGQKCQGYGAMSFLPSLKKFFHVLLSTRAVSILPVRNDSRASPIKTTSQVNELTLHGARVFFKASKPTGNSIAGDFNILSSLTYEESCLNEIISNWMALQGYYMVKCDCQTSDMVKIGFLTRVHPFVWREDLRNEIKNTALRQSSPFQLRRFPGSLSCNKKGIMAPVMMVEVERDEVSTGLEFFCHAFTGNNPLSSCGLSYLFFTLYQNQLTDSERFDIIQDANHHVGDVDLLHLHGFQEIDSLVTLK